MVARTMTEAERWLERHHDEQFFLYVDTWDPHEPWDAPDYYTAKYREGYAGEQLYPCVSTDLLVLSGGVEAVKRCCRRGGTRPSPRGRHRGDGLGARPGFVGPCSEKPTLAIYTTDTRSCQVGS